NLVAQSLMSLNGTLFFAADDGVHGVELWRLVPGANLGLSGFPATVTAGAAASFTVTARNADGSTNTGYLGNVHFTSSDPQALLPPDYVFAPSDGGIHTFSVTLQTAGAWTVFADDAINPSIGGAVAVRVAPAAPSVITATTGTSQQARPGTA